ncbi:S-methylmethionine--homocysteine S-methyltransferase BHMT2-like [Haemaphysalis longicornis]
MEVLLAITTICGIDVSPREPSSSSTGVIVVDDIAIMAEAVASSLETPVPAACKAAKPYCTNCGGPHVVLDHSCPRWQEERRVCAELVRAPAPASRMGVRAALRAATQPQPPPVAPVTMRQQPGSSSVASGTERQQHTAQRQPSSQAAAPEGGLLERLERGVVIGDGGFLFTLEKRCYVKAGPWTPEATVEHPEAVRALHREFMRAGADVVQAFTFYAVDDRLIAGSRKYTGEDVNEAACKLAREVASERNALVAGTLTETPFYACGRPKSEVQDVFRAQVDIFVKNKVDFIICEYFSHVEEIVMAIEVCKSTGLPVVGSMCIGPEGDMDGVSTGECAVRMVRAGAHVVGINCHFDPFVVLSGIRIMMDALKAAGLKAHFLTQPLAFHTPDATKTGFIDLPEFPFALEPRLCSRWDIQRYAREAYEMGVRYIGGCCGFEPYHIRAIAEELSDERGGRLPPSSDKHGTWGEGLRMHTKPWVRARASRAYWEELRPATGRPLSASLTLPDALDLSDR